MNPEKTAEQANDAPLTQLSVLILAGKTAAAQTRRGLHNLKSRIKRHDRQNELYPHILAESRSPLWNKAEPDTYDLQQIRVQNLRCAVHSLHGARIAAGEIFSFWKEVGRPTRAKGYARGYDVREDILTPVLGSGLFQLAGALHETALQSGLHILESRPQLHAVPGGSVATRHDTAIAWNYIDLRFRAHFGWQIEAILTETELIVRLRDTRPPRRTPDKEAPAGETPAPALALEDKPSMEEPSAHLQGRTFYVLDEYWPEFQAFIDSEHIGDAGMAIPLDGDFWNRPRYRWQTKRYRQIVTATLPTLRRSRKMRSLKGYGPDRLQTELDTNAAIATALGKRLPPDAMHLLVAQPMLPWLWRSGFLGGRTFDVLMTSLPLVNLHAILDEAHALYPQRESLSEFRAEKYIVEAETAALEAANRVITPHTVIARLFPGKVKKIPWQLTAHLPAQVPPAFTIAFPGPTAASKGAFEVREAARAMQAEVVLVGPEQESIGFWAGVRTRETKPGENWLEGVSVVVQPALVEDRPRHLLTALASGVPVIASEACGLEPHRNLIVIPPGNGEVLLKALSLLKEKMYAAGSSSPGRDNEPKT